MRLLLLFIGLFLCSFTFTFAQSDEQVTNTITCYFPPVYTDSLCPIMAHGMISIDALDSIFQSDGYYDGKKVSALISANEDPFAKKLGSIKDAKVSNRLLWKCDGDMDPGEDMPRYKLGRLERTFMRADTVICTQKIDIMIHASRLFNESDIEWPKDIKLRWKDFEDLMIDDDLDIGGFIVQTDSTFHISATPPKDFKYPQHKFELRDLDPDLMKEVGVGECYTIPTFDEKHYSLIGVHYEDTYIKESAKKVDLLRTWSIIDWCQFEPKTGYGIWRHTQKITMR